MRCTKCHYLSFEPEPRCRNCGHDLSLEEGSGFSLDDADFDQAGQSGRSGHTATAVLASPRTATTSSANRIATAELPLFVQSMQGVSEQLAYDHDDHPEELEPLVKVPARPRTPVSVRRATPDPARLRAKYGLSPNPEPDLWSNLPADPIDSVNLHDNASAYQDLPLTSDPNLSWTNEPAQEQAPVGWHEQDRWPEQAQAQEQDLEAVGFGTRLMSAAIDGALLASISATVIYFTLRVTGLSVTQITVLPALPIVALLLMLAVGYQLMFTVASGQTLGKMAMNIKVVGSEFDPMYGDRPTVSQATVRTLAALPSALAFGLGFAPALGGSGLTVHDRIAHTRVVRR